MEGSLINLVFLLAGSIVLSYTLYWHYRSLKEGTHPYLSIERVKKLKTKEDRINDRKQKNR